MREYGKTENIFMRDPDTHRLIPWAFRQDEFSLINEHAWMFTEKIDGTNVRLTFIPAQDGADYEMDGLFTTVFQGRTDNATLPKGLEPPKFPLEVQGELGVIGAVYQSLGLADELGPRGDIAVTLYGEAYGAGIQKGGMYCPDKRIRFFDLVTTPIIDGQHAGEGSFRPWHQMQTACEILGLQYVPVVRFARLLDAVEAVREGIPSLVAGLDGGSGGDMEGLVGRTEPYLYDFRGHRVFFKVKTKDLRS